MQGDAATDDVELERLRACIRLQWRRVGRAGSGVVVVVGGVPLVAMFWKGMWGASDAGFAESLVAGARDLRMTSPGDVILGTVAALVAIAISLSALSAPGDAASPGWYGRYSAREVWSSVLTAVAWGCCLVLAFIGAAEALVPDRQPMLIAQSGVALLLAILLTAGIAVFTGDAAKQLLDTDTRSAAIRAAEDGLATATGKVAHRGVGRRRLWSNAALLSLGCSIVGHAWAWATGWRYGVDDMGRAGLAWALQTLVAVGVWTMVGSMVSTDAPTTSVKWLRFGSRVIVGLIAYGMPLILFVLGCALIVLGWNAPASSLGIAFAATGASTLVALRAARGPGVVLWGSAARAWTSTIAALRRAQERSVRDAAIAGWIASPGRHGAQREPSTDRHQIGCPLCRLSARWRARRDSGSPV